MKNKRMAVLLAMTVTALSLGAFAACGGGDDGPITTGELVKDENGNEYWSSRDLCNAMGYSAYWKFQKVIDKAIKVAGERGMNVDDVLQRLEGIQCGHRTTSCPDQLCKAIRQIISK